MISQTVTASASTGWVAVAVVTSIILLFSLGVIVYLLRRGNTKDKNDNFSQSQPGAVKEEQLQLQMNENNEGQVMNVTNEGVDDYGSVQLANETAMAPVANVTSGNILYV